MPIRARKIPSTQAFRKDAGSPDRPRQELVAARKRSKAFSRRSNVVPISKLRPSFARPYRRMKIRLRRTHQPPCLFRKNERTADADCRGGQFDVAWIGARSPNIMRRAKSGSGSMRALRDFANQARARRPIPAVFPNVSQSRARSQPSEQGPRTIGPCGPSRAPVSARWFSA